MNVLFFETGVEFIKFLPKFKSKFKIDSFVFIESYPRSKINYSETFDYNLSKPDYENRIILFMKQFNFKLVSKIELDIYYKDHILTNAQWLYYFFENLDFLNPKLLIFENDEIKIKYYISTNIQNNICDYLEHDLENCGVVFCDRYLPGLEIIKYGLPKTLVCKDIMLKTDYESILNILQHPKHFCYFKEYYLFTNEFIKKNHFNDILNNC